MKKRLLIACSAFMFFAMSGNAQTYRGGLPWSVSDNSGTLTVQTIPTIQAATPDYASIKKEDAANNSSNRVGVASPLDVNINNSGIITYLQDGSAIWRLNIKIEGALSNDLQFDEFNLPRGVALYVSNKNGKQLEGAFTYLDNADAYSTASIQGDEVHIELDIPSGIKLSDIKMHISKIFANYRGGIAVQLNALYSDAANNGVVAQPMTNEGDYSDPCHINAVCPPDGVTFEDLRRTAGHIYEVVGNSAYVCSGNLINNTAQDCRPLFITASHCEGGGSTTANSSFNTWKFYFDYEYPNCTGNAPGSAPTNHYLTGANFVARSTHDPIVEGESLVLIGDFLLLELKDPLNKLGNQFGAYLGGWSRSGIAPQNTKFIDFSYPAGDPKKMTVFYKVKSNGTFNQNSVPATHWAAYLESGGIEGGSSGSALFAESTRQMIGVLSGGVNGATACDTTYPSLFSKISRDWDYPEGNGNPIYRLMDHLDPGGTGAMSVPTVKMSASSGASLPTNCAPTGVEEINALNDAINIYPNPSNGNISLQVHLDKTTALTIKVYDVAGREVGKYETSKIKSGTIQMNLSNLSSGIYVLRINSENATISKKVIIQ